MATSFTTTPQVQQAGETAGPAPEAVRPRRAARRFHRSPKFFVGAGTVVLFVLMAVAGALFADDANAISDELLQPPSLAHPMGTTNTGQDVFQQVLAGASGSLLVGLFSGLISSGIALLVGVVSGFLGGVADETLSLVTNVFLVIPGLPLIVLMTTYIEGSGYLAIAAVIGITGWAGGARVIRAQTLSLRNRDYIDAVRVSGERSWRIVVFEMLPNLTPILAGGFLGSVIAGILAEAGISFLGLGTTGSTSWGSMLYYAQNAGALSLGAWWWFVPPGLCIALLGTGLSLLNFTVDEVVNPRLRTTRVKKEKR